MYFFNWRFFVLNWRIFLVELTYLTCLTDRFFGLKWISSQIHLHADLWKNFRNLSSYYDDYDDHYEVPCLNWMLIRTPYLVKLEPSNITDEQYEVYGITNRTSSLKEDYRLILILWRLIQLKWKIFSPFLHFLNAGNF